MPQDQLRKRRHAMGAWGPGLYQNDVALDVKDTYEDLLYAG